MQRGNSTAWKKVKDIYVCTYNTHETTFSNQTGQFPMQSKHGNKYIMVLVKIDSNAILIKLMTSCKDAEMIQAYDVLVQCLLAANIHPQKHVLNNKILDNMKLYIKEKYKFQLEMVPPGCH